MKLAITIKYNAGDEATYVAQPPEWAKWEKATSKVISQASENLGMWDLLFLAYNAMKREAAGKPVKPFDVWMETVSDIEVGDSDPKAISPEA
jgi:hypothetical protein